MNAQKIYGENVYVNLDEVIETVYQCRADVADREWEKRWLEPLMRLEKKEVSEDAISREYLEEQYWQTLIPKGVINTDIELGINIGITKMHENIKNAPSVVPKRSCYRCGLREDCEDSTERKPKEGADGKGMK